MAQKKLNVTEDHIKLLQGIKFEKFVFDNDTRNGRIGWGIDQYSPWGGVYPIEQIALILGCWDKFIPGTEEDFDGRKFPQDLSNHFWDLYEDITENMEYYWDLLIYYTDKGGLTPGTYKYNLRLKEWTKLEK
jgi:hypothetical protein